MGGGGLTRGAAGERRRQTSGGAVAGARILAKTGTEQVNGLHGQLHRGLGKVLRWWVGSGDEREAELVDGYPAAAVGETTPASWQLEQTNKRAQELQGVLKEWEAARVGEEKQAGVEFTVRHPWRTAAARRPREEGPAGFIALRKAVGGKVFLRTKGTKSGYGSWHGRSTARRGGGDVRRVRRRGLVGRRGAGTAALWPMGARHVAPRE
jgi:hypothetical protein